MSEPVVSLVERRFTPNPVVLESARKMLALVESGEVEGVVWCAARKDGQTEEELAGVVGPLLVGAVALLQHKLVRELENWPPDPLPPPG